MARSEEAAAPPRPSFDVGRLRSALDGSRRSRDWSWNRLAAEVGVSPSLFSRMGHGLGPDLNSLAAILAWLGQPAESFMTGQVTPSVPLEAQLLPLIHGSDLDDASKQHIEELLTAALRYARSRAAGPEEAG